jgi:hypothetical protein
MARNVQPLSSRSPGGSFLGLLANALFWFVVAVVVPVEDVVRAFPELASYAQWAPVLCYALAFWSFLRALRVLKDLAANRAMRARLGDVARAERPASDRKGKRDAALPVRRTPTVQRMR